MWRERQWLVRDIYKVGTARLVTGGERDSGTAGCGHWRDGCVCHFEEELIWTRQISFDLVVSRYLWLSEVESSSRWRFGSGVGDGCRKLTGSCE